MTFEEIHVAETYWIKKAQVSEVHDSNIELKEDDKGVWRCNGRIPGYKPIETYDKWNAGRAYEASRIASYKIIEPDVGRDISLGYLANR